jgi:predicted nucleotidyltransferase
MHLTKEMPNPSSAKHRLEEEKATLLKVEILKFIPEAKVFLFGSRVDLEKKGGDIDVLILGSRRLTTGEKVQIKLEYHMEFGEEKIDLVSFAENDDTPFKQIALHSAVQL